MTELPILDALPSGFVVARGARGVLAARTELAAELARAGFAPDGGEELSASDLYGRRSLGEIALERERLVVRRFHHGGLLRWLTGTRFRDAERPFRELALAHQLRALGIATPEIVAARAVAAPGGGWRLDVVTRRVEGARDLGQVLLQRARGELGLRAWRTLLGAAGRFVRELHDRGLFHADLTPRNVLVERATLESARPALWILDLDRSELRETLGVAERRTNLRRLLRHVARLSLEGRARLSRTDLARFLTAYEPERAARREHARAILREHERSRALHSTGWILERGLGGRRSDAR